MTPDEPTPFIEYWNAVDAALMKFFGIDTADAGIEAELIAGAQEEGQTPGDFARWYGEKYDLSYREEWERPRAPQAKAPSEDGQVFRVPVKLFDLGQIVSTPGALKACSRERLRQCLALHIRGDWGVVCAEDRKSNFEALFTGLRILSAYPIDPAKPCKGGSFSAASTHFGTRRGLRFRFVAVPVLLFVTLQHGA
jgi:hypothetical protein